MSSSPTKGCTVNKFYTHGATTISITNNNNVNALAVLNPALFCIHTTNPSINVPNIETNLSFHSWSSAAV
ncbi:hypothetical protein LguiA_003721 [Lonicera macranthoides]